MPILKYAPDFDATAIVGADNQGSPFAGESRRTFGRAIYAEWKRTGLNPYTIFRYWRNWALRGDTPTADMRENLSDREQFRIYQAAVQHGLIDGADPDGILAVHFARSLGNVAGTFGGEKAAIVRISGERDVALFDNIVSDSPIIAEAQARHEQALRTPPATVIRIQRAAENTGWDYNALLRLYESMDPTERDRVFAFQPNATFQRVQIDRLMQGQHLLSGAALQEAAGVLPMSPNASDPSIPAAGGTGYARGAIEVTDATLSVPGFNGSFNPDLLLANAIVDPSIVPGSPAAQDKAAALERRKIVGLLLLVALPAVLLLRGKKG